MSEKPSKVEIEEDSVELGGAGATSSASAPAIPKVKPAKKKTPKKKEGQETNGGIAKKENKSKRGPRRPLRRVDDTKVNFMIKQLTTRAQIFSHKLKVAQQRLDTYTFERNIRDEEGRE